jgi:LysR family glycine cleavage system transcriptional activator
MSFTRAAEELFVSQAAISRQVRELEVLVGRPLFDRVHRGVVLTEAGHKLLAELTASFDRLDAALDEAATTRHADRVSVSCEPSFAVLWLVEHLAEFREKHPDIDVIIDADPRPIEFRASQAEIAIRCSAARSSWPRTQSMLLFETQMLAVACPDLVAKGPALHAPADVLDHTLLHIENRDMWHAWLRQAGVDATAQIRGPVYDDVGMVLRAVLSGHGIGLVDRLFAEPEIEAGNIVRAFDVELAGGAYFVVARDFARLPTAATQFVEWITQAFSAA